MELRSGMSLSRPAGSVAALLAGLALMMSFTAASAGPAPEGDGGKGAASGEWVCPPCGCAGDGKVHAKRAICESCRMKLVLKEQVQNVAVLVFDGVQIIDFTGPWEVFGQAGFRVYSVSDTGQPVTTAMGMKLTPDYSLANSPQPTILLVPGGGVRSTYGDTAIIDWVKKTAQSARHVISVCNGAFILARAGLLDGNEATTFYGLLDELEEFAPGVKVVRDRRFVDNGKVITSAGLSSGIDASLHLVEKIKGRGETQVIALRLEYPWDPEAGFARGLLAEVRMPRLRPPDGALVDVLSTQGDQDRWETIWRIESPLTAEELMRNLDGQLRALPGWTPAAAVVAPAGGTPAQSSAWKLKGADGTAWAGEVSISPGGPGASEVSMSVRRDGKS